MQKWEYNRVVVKFLSGRKTFDNIKVVISNDKQVMEQASSSVFFDYLKQQGIDGWELVSGSSSYIPNDEYIEAYFFRRPIQ